MKVFVLFLSALASVTTVAQAADDRAFDDRPEFYFMDQPSFIFGSRVGHISSIKREQDLVFNGHIRYSREDGKLNDWVDTTYNNKAAWLHSRGAREALSRLGVGNPTGELKRVTSAKRERAKAAAQPSGAHAYWQTSTQQFSTTGRAPAAQMPMSGTFQTGVSGVHSANPVYQGLTSAANVGLGSSGGGSPAPAVNPNDPQATWTNSTSPGVAIPICAKSRAEFDENKILQKAFEGSKNPFSSWSDPANDASLSPNGQGQWDLIVQGAILKTLPIQVCVEKEGAEPYLAIWNKHFDIKDDGTVQTVYLEDIEGHKGTFTQQSVKQKARSGTKQSTVR